MGIFQATSYCKQHAEAEATMLLGVIRHHYAITARKWLPIFGASCNCKQIFKRYFGVGREVLRIIKNKILKKKWKLLYSDPFYAKPL